MENDRSYESYVDFGSLRRVTLGVSIAREQVKRSGESVSLVLIPQIYTECSPG